MSKIGSFHISRRFCGPPGSGNGGYSVGLLARVFDYKAEVTLRVPPPLETDMQIVQDGDMARMMSEKDGAEVLVGEAVATVLEGKPPAFVDLAAAQNAATSFRGFEHHVFPTCFVCGPDRKEGDGLRIFPGDVGEEDYVAAPWHVDASLDRGDGFADSLFVAAALDCPGYFASVSGEKALLGRMSLDISGVPLPVGQDAVVVACKDAEDGRKRFASTAVYTPAGDLVGWSRQIWIVVQE